MVEKQLPKLMTRVRFPSPAPPIFQADPVAGYKVTASRISRRTMAAVATFLLLGGCMGTAPTAPYPFVGTWDCDGTVYTFTNSGYSDGSISADFFSVAAKGLGYELRFRDGSLMVLAAITESGMTWVVNQTGAQRQCRRL